MSLDSAKTQFVNDVVAAMESGSGGSKQDFAQNLADAVVALVKSATVSTAVTGVCPSGGGPLAGGAGTGSLS